MSFDPYAVGRPIQRDRPPVLGMFGPTVELLTVGEPADPTAPGLVRSRIAPGCVVPMHAHSDPETFYVLSGQLEVLAVENSGPRWTPVSAGQIFHVPANARHALRNRGSGPAVVLIVTTPRMVRFVEAVGTPVEDAVPGRPPAPEAMRRFVTESAARGYWNASAEENEEVGIESPPPRRAC